MPLVKAMTHEMAVSTMNLAPPPLPRYVDMNSMKLETCHSVVCYFMKKDSKWWCDTRTPEFRVCFHLWNSWDWGALFPLIHIPLVLGTWSQICKLFESPGRSFGENPQANTDSSRPPELSSTGQNSYSVQLENSPKLKITWYSVSLVNENLTDLAWFEITKSL